MNIARTIELLSYTIIPLIFAITLHEAAHGWMANRCGDPTARSLGRISLNPLRHIDLFGTILLPIAMLLFSGWLFGWAKPVPINPQRLRQPKIDMIKVALAGPGANFIMVFLWMLLSHAALFGLAHSSSTGLHTVLIFMLKNALVGIFLNLILGLFNLLPLPPLDGSRVVASLLPDSLARTYNRIERYGIWILLALLLLFSREFHSVIMSLRDIVTFLAGVPFK